jgi:torulene dioxygenase
MHDDALLMCEQFNALGDTKTRIPLKISGTIPSYAAGTLYRTGPGGYKVPRSDPKDGIMACDHWFDGFTTVHKFDLVAGADGKCSEIWYSSRSHADELIESARETGKLEGTTVGQKRRDPCDALYRKLKSVFEPVADGPSTNIGVTVRAALPCEVARSSRGGEGRNLLTTTTDNHNTRLFDADTLEPLEIVQNRHLHPALRGTVSAAHAAEDPVTGDTFNYNLDFGMFAIYRVFRASRITGEVEVLAHIVGLDVQGAYIHSLSLTENFVILCVWPAFYTNMGISILWYGNLMEALAPFDPKAKATWYVVDRTHRRGVVAKFTSPAFFCFHTTNAWEEQRSDDPTAVDVMCELVERKDTSALYRFYYENLVSDGAGVASNRAGSVNTPEEAGLARYKLSSVPSGEKTKARSKTGVAERILYIPSPNAGDLPRFNPNYALKPHRYVWSVVDRGKSSFIDGLCKTDTLTQTACVWEQERHTPGEPVFVPNPDGEGEDDGVVLSVVFDGDSGTSYLICLDASNLLELGRAELGMPVGLGFHGTHRPANTPWR